MRNLHDISPEISIEKQRLLKIAAGLKYEFPEFAVKLKDNRVWYRFVTLTSWSVLDNDPVIQNYYLRRGEGLPFTEDMLD